MPRLFRSGLPLIALAALLLVAAEDKNKDKKGKGAPKPSPVTITKVDADKGEITVKYPDPKGKQREKTFQLTDDVRFVDETGRVVKIDVFQAGHDALILESKGKLREVRRSLRPHQGRRLSDAVKTLIEMTGSGHGYTEEVQRIYDMLRKLDTDKNGKIDPEALQAERERIVAERIDALYKRLDTDNDGKISNEEARGWVKEHFEKLDLNKDGFLDRDELLKAARAWQKTKSSEQEKK